MGKHVLVPMDRSDPARAALEFACETYPDATLTVVYVVDPAEMGTHTTATDVDADEFEAHIERGRQAAETVFEEARSIAADHDREIGAEALAGNVARAIVERVRGGDVDHVVIGSHGRDGVRRLLLGSVAERVARRSTVPVTIVR
ncbi:universal stress protein [Salinilacihabitans rarus]|uniref:universal stress protein n=1 Tax=Salinilacihabitans rarus TaxID=2961596 RepID=UPI0020C8AD05|nr:universal stress protein [Salinilacihabitans rarus]